MKLFAKSGVHRQIDQIKHKSTANDHYEEMVRITKILPVPIFKKAREPNGSGYTIPSCPTAGAEAFKEAHFYDFVHLFQKDSLVQAWGLREFLSRLFMRVHKGFAF